MNSAEQHDLAKQLTLLIGQCQLGDRQAFQQLYQLTSAQLNGIAYRITQNLDCANEVLQEAFIQIWQNCHQYRADKGEPFTWLASIVRYRAYDRLRHLERRQNHNTLTFDEFHDSPTVSQTAAFNLAELDKKQLDRCLSQLSDHHSQSIIMAYIYGCSRDEISDYFKAPVNTIKSWIRRGLGSLKLCLTQ
ncbi:sigma-70 family RNA polymerase sigma factor [Catenovulum sp. SM1970]|uniref:RNA polymerase sigma factor n=1 Tax=Marinifaba aquimaris TaxID=2741323 RepID=UPI001571F930|nr:sigma-70 family RNA polymerase sigma factor [Marinifaba aquimaris]NTS77223.1 sigma-70 family RNA polymerase sigma factor [Marinifaba aquimaris]